MKENLWGYVKKEKRQNSWKKDRENAEERQNRAKGSRKRLPLKKYSKSNAETRKKTSRETEIKEKKNA